MKIIRKILAIFGIFIVFSAFLLFSLVGFADDINGSTPGSSAIDWDSFSIAGPLDVGGQSYTTLITGDPASFFVEDGVSEISNGVQFEHIFRNPSFYNDYPVLFNNSFTNNSLITTCEFDVKDFAMQVETITYSCKSLVLTGQQFYDYFNSLVWKFVPSGGNDYVECQYDLSFKVNSVATTWFVGPQTQPANNNYALATLNNTSGNPRTYTFSGSRLGNTNNAFFPLSNYSASEFKNVIANFDYATYYDFRNGYDPGSVVDVGPRGLTEAFCFSDVSITFHFITQHATSVKFYITQSYIVDKPSSSTFGNINFTQHEDYWYSDASIDFTPVVKATASFFDMHIGPGDLSLGMLGMFGLGIVFVIILIKLFKGG